MDIEKFIIEQALIIIPVLYVIGAFIKRLETIKDKYIPLILLALGVAFSIGILGVSVQAIIQGVLVSGATVLGDQLFKQINKQE